MRKDVTQGFDQPPILHRPAPAHRRGVARLSRKMRMLDPLIISDGDRFNYRFKRD
jgi:hypothetical protein